MSQPAALIRTELDWILAKISGQPAAEAPHAPAGASLRRRVVQSVSKVAEVDEQSGCLRKFSDTEKVIGKISACITGAEAVPFLDALLLTARSSQRVLKTVIGNISVFTTLLRDNALDRDVTLRVLAIPRMCDPEILSEISNEFSDTIKKIIDETIDPVIRTQAIEISASLDALKILGHAAKPPLTKSQLIEASETSSLCLKCDSADHAECDRDPAVCVNCRGERAKCMRGCTEICRVCGASHAGRSLRTCLEETLHGKKRKSPPHDEEGGEKRMRSTREYKEAKRKHKEEKKISAPLNFEKLLKDTVARRCFEQLGDAAADAKLGDTEIPEWRRVYRQIAAVLMEKEARMPDEVRFKCGTSEERAAVMKRVTQYCDKHLTRKNHP